MSGTTIGRRGREDAGVLAIWNDCDRAREAEYERWYRCEHLAERLSVPGFRSARRYEAIGGEPPRFFTSYDLDAPGVLVSPVYLAQCNNPSPLTRKVIGEGIFLNLDRTACRRIFVLGDIRGGFALAARWSDAPSFAAAVECAERLAVELIEAGRALRAEVWQAVAEGTGTPSVEQSLRGGTNQSIAGAFIMETMREADLAEISRAAAASLGRNVTIGGYRLLCSIAKCDMDA